MTFETLRNPQPTVKDVSRPALTKTAAYTAVPGDYILVNATTAAVTITLPAPTVATAVPISVKKIDTSANAVTVMPTSGTIDGIASLVLTAQNSARDLITDGTNWWIA